MSDPAPSRRAHIAMALYADLTYDSRVRREAASLAEAGYRVSIVCLANEGGTSDLPPYVEVIVRRPNATLVLPGTVVPGADHPYLGQSGRGRIRRIVDRVRWLRSYVVNLREWGRIAGSAVAEVDAWHAHDLPGLAAIAGGVDAHTPIVYDSHELFLDAGTATKLPGIARRLLRRMEARLIARSAAVITVNEDVAAVLVERYRPRRMEVVRNCPPRWTPMTSDRQRLRMHLGIPVGEPIVLYHGALGPTRGIEELIGTLRGPLGERIHVVVMGSGLLRETCLREAADPSLHGRLHVMDPVPPSELLSWVSGADIGTCLIHPSTLSHALSTPNKLFECLAAGVPVVASDEPPTRTIVVGQPSGSTGVVCDPTDVEAVGRAIASILDLPTDEAVALRARAWAAAQERWNWETEVASLLRVYADILPADAPGRRVAGTTRTAAQLPTG